MIFYCCFKQLYRIIFNEDSFWNPNYINNWINISIILKLSCGGDFFFNNSSGFTHIVSNILNLHLFSNNYILTNLTFFLQESILYEWLSNDIDNFFKFKVQGLNGHLVVKKISFVIGDTPTINVSIIMLVATGSLSDLTF